MAKSRVGVNALVGAAERKEARTSSIVDRLVVTEPEPVTQDPFIVSRARHLAKLYSKHKQTYTGHPHRTASKLFLKVADKTRYMTPQGLVDYVGAHFDFYGVDTYPGHLASDRSLVIYHSYYMNKYCAESYMDNDERYRYECSLLELFSRIWEISIKEMYQTATPLFPTVHAKVALNDKATVAFLERLPTEAVSPSAR